jgi:signal transduction protein with GAF and PtsI domain
MCTILGMLEPHRRADYCDVFSRSMLGLAFAILNVRIMLILICENENLTANHLIRQSWTALSASLSLSLPSGGSVSVVWGNVLLDLRKSQQNIDFISYRSGDCRYLQSVHGSLSFRVPFCLSYVSLETFVAS